MDRAFVTKEGALPIVTADEVQRNSSTYILFNNKLIKTSIPHVSLISRTITINISFCPYPRTRLFRQKSCFGDMRTKDLGRPSLPLPNSKMRGRLKGCQALDYQNNLDKIAEGIGAQHKHRLFKVEHRHDLPAISTNGFSKVENTLFCS